VLSIKIVLIGILLPLHHWVEKRVVAYLLRPSLVNISQLPIRARMREQLLRFHRKHMVEDPQETDKI
jgi:hypothetical protein